MAIDAPYGFRVCAWHDQLGTDDLACPICQYPTAPIPMVLGDDVVPSARPTMPMDPRRI